MARLNAGVQLAIEAAVRGGLNLYHPRTDLVVGNDDEVEYRLINATSQVAKWQLTLNDGGHSRHEMVMVGEGNLTTDGRYDGAIQPLVECLAVAPGAPVDVTLRPGSYLAIRTYYTWQAGGNDPAVQLALPAAPAAISVSNLGDYGEDRGMGWPEWATRTT